jgi:hypothetical protein
MVVSLNQPRPARMDQHSPGLAGPDRDNDGVAGPGKRAAPLSAPGRARHRASTGRTALASPGRGLSPTSRPPALDERAEVGQALVAPDQLGQALPPKEVPRLRRVPFAPSSQIIKSDGLGPVE